MLAILLCVCVSLGQPQADEMPSVVVAKDKKSFVLEPSGKPFVPWGFNYDHDTEGRLIEDYWDKEWDKVEAHFGQMKKLGANVVRIHFQVGKFMETADRLDEKSLDRLTKLVSLAEKERLYLDLTGLGCYHKADVPAWYDKLSEKDRWDVQTRFWEAVAGRCAKSPAIFCYDLMNEPVVPGGKRKDGDWLGPAFGGKHFVQFITLDQQKRPRPDIARQWIKQLVAAIRKHDKRHLVTVGLVDWSLDRPGLTSGFVPVKIADDLDFMCVHLYPEKGKVDEALKTLEGFAAVGKPVVIEETFQLKCSMKEFEEFIEGSKKHAAGWIGFYWGKPPEELRRGKTIGDAVMLAWLEFFQKNAPSRFTALQCEGFYPMHLQGICTDDKEAIFWCFTDALVKTDTNGKALKKVPVANHHGDLCHHDGKIFVAVNLGKFNEPKGKADSWVYVYDAKDLSFLSKHEIQQVVHGAGGMAHHDGRFFVVGGLPKGVEENYVYEYDRKFKHLKTHVLKSGYTLLGIQTATFANGYFWFGCYGGKLLKADATLKLVGSYDFDCSLGILGIQNNQFLVARGPRVPDKGHTGTAVIAVMDAKKGLVIQGK